MIGFTRFHAPGSFKITTYAGAPLSGPWPDPPKRGEPCVEPYFHFMVVLRHLLIQQKWQRTKACPIRAKSVPVVTLSAAKKAGFALSLFRSASCQRNFLPGAASASIVLFHRSCKYAKLKAPLACTAGPKYKKLLGGTPKVEGFPIFTKDLSTLCIIICLSDIAIYPTYTRSR